MSVRIMGKKRTAKTQEDEALTPPPEEVEPKPHRRRGCLPRFLAYCLLLLICYFVGLCLFIDVYGQWDRARPAQAIIVFGARVDNNHEPGDSLRSRTLHAVDLYHRGLATKIICTGGLGDNAPTEAEAAACLAKDQGVPAGALLLEVESTDTTENAANAASICRSHHWTRVIAVSDPYHLWRVKRDLNRVGISAYTSPAKDCKRNRILALRAQWTAREGLAIMRDQLCTVFAWGWRYLCHELHRL